MQFLKSLSAQLASFLALYGGWGLFGISFLDSSILSFPFVNDLLLIHLSSQSPRRAPFYALACAAGSVLGASVMYAMARGSANALQRKDSLERRQKVRQWLERNDFVAILVASLLPPPVPFKLFSVSAGALRVDFSKFAAALLLGRALRFALAAWMGARYGVQAETYLKHNIIGVSLAAIALILGATLLYRRVLARPAA